MRYRTMAILTLSLFLFLPVRGWAQTETLINNFEVTNGAYPQGPVILDKSGNLYGMAENGGTHGCGVVYELLNSGGTWTENQLYNFTCGNDGGFPTTNGLAIDPAGNLYGTTAMYGIYNEGVVFELSNSGGTWTQAVLYSFTGGADGGAPYAGVVVGAEGSLYGTAYMGGGGGCVSTGCGVVYRLSRSGNQWREKVIHIFQQNGRDGLYPQSPLTLDKAGNIYGTTTQGGGFGGGVIFKLRKPKKRGLWKESILHYFYGRIEGCSPGYNGIEFDTDGNIYGTNNGCGPHNYGTVYQLKKSKFDNYKLHVILNFNYSNGGYPYDAGTLAVDRSGNVYGTTSSGGAYSYGLVFKLAAKTWTFTDLHDFDPNINDGNIPYSGLIIDSSGTLYGTTKVGGNSSYYGAVYQLVP